MGDRESVRSVPLATGVCAGGLSAADGLGGDVTGAEARPFRDPAPWDEGPPNAPAVIGGDPDPDPRSILSPPASSPRLMERWRSGMRAGRTHEGAARRGFAGLSIDRKGGSP